MLKKYFLSFEFPAPKSLKINNKNVELKYNVKESTVKYNKTSLLFEKRNTTRLEQKHTKWLFRF